MINAIEKITVKCPDGVHELLLTPVFKSIGCDESHPTASMYHLQGHGYRYELRVEEPCECFDD